MSTEEPRWRAGLRGTLDAITERAFEKGPGITEAGMQLLDSHIAEAERRGWETALREAADKIRAADTAAIGDDAREIFDRAADLIDPDKDTS